MIFQEFPLLELFTRLRKAGLPLGIDEYQTALRALQSGFGISNLAALKRLCQTLWVKSTEEARLFDHHFEQVLPRGSMSEQDAPPSLLSEQPVSSSLFAPPLPISDHSTSDSPPVVAPEMTVHIEDEVQVAQAIKQTAAQDEEFAFGHYTSSDEYFPVTRRQMKQSWRYLRRPIRAGPPTELDVEATIKEIGRNGILLEPTLIPRRINRTELLLLIDHGGSMVPFHMLSHRLIETVLRGGRLGKAHIYYFHNCPDEYLYYDLAYQEYAAIEEVLSQRYSQHAGVLIFSDGGAARGGFNSERLDLTMKFLKQLKQQFRYLVWLNPVPHTRWTGATAGKVMQIIPMFDVSRQGLDNAIGVLRGRPSHNLNSWRGLYYE